MRFSLDVHIAVINDVKHILNNVYGDKVEFVDGLCRSTGMCCIRKARGEIHNREHVAVFEPAMISDFSSTSIGNFIHV
jgi:hypothetical protein